MRDIINRNIRPNLVILLSLALFVVLVYGYLYESNQDSGHSSSNLNTSDNKEVNVLIELITDPNDSISLEFSNRLKKTTDYTKLPIKEISIKDWNSPLHKISSTTKVIAVQNTLKLNDNTFDRLLNFVSKGGLLFVPNFIKDDRMAYFYGLNKNGSRERDENVVGYYFNTNFLPNVKGTNYADSIYHGALKKTSFKDDVSILASAINDKDYPTIIENNIGLGSVILFNTNQIVRKRDRGLLFSALLTGLDGIPQPITNISSIWNHFPSPLSVDVSAEEDTIIAKDWRESKYSFSKNEEEYSVQRIDNNKEGEYYWFLYTSNKNSERVETELSIKTETYEKTPILKGNLYLIKTTIPTLSIKNGNLNTLLTSTIARRVTEDYNIFNSENKEHEITDLVKPNVKTKPSKKDSLQEYNKAISTPRNKEEIAKTLKRLLKKDPSLKNELNYLKHLIAYKPKQAIIELNTYISNESSSLWSISDKISQLYANNKSYKKAYNWSKHTQKISIVKKLYWLSEIKDFQTLREEYENYIANNPNDVKTKDEIAKILIKNNQQIESWGFVSELSENTKKDTLKSLNNEQIIYVKRVSEKDLMNRFSKIPELKIKEEIKTETEEEILLSKANLIEAKTEVIGDKNSAVSFEKKITYSLKTNKLNAHSISVTNNDLYDLEHTGFSDQDNVNKNVFGIEYKYNNTPSDKLNYWVRGRVEKDNQNSLYYQAGIGISFSKEKSFTSVIANINPVKTGPGYEKKIYQSQLAIFQENAIGNLFKTVFYAEGNHYSNNDLEGSITTRLILDNNKEKMFKILPQLEASFTKSNSDKIKDYPFFLVKKRFFAGGGVGLKYGKETSKLNVSVEGSTFIDNDLGNFNRLSGQASLKIGNFTRISVSGELSNQSQAFSNFLAVGLKHNF